VRLEAEKWLIPDKNFW